jgi:hypothetical protein
MGKDAGSDDTPRRTEQDEEEFCAKLDKKTPDRIGILNRWVHPVFKSLVTTSVSFGEIGQRPETHDRKDGGSFAAVVAGRQCYGLTGLVTQQNARLPVVKVSEPEAVGELQNGDDLLRHAFREPSLLWRATGFKSCLKLEVASQLARERTSCLGVNFWGEF